MPNPFVIETRIKDLPFRTPGPWIRSLIGDGEAICLLSDGGKFGRYSYICPSPTEVARLSYEDPDDFREQLKALIPQRQPIRTSGRDQNIVTAFPEIFSGGLIGLFGFEWGLRLEDMPHKAFQLGKEAWPDVVIWQSGPVIGIDHHQKTSFLAFHESLATGSASLERKALDLEAAYHLAIRKDEEDVSLSPVADWIGAEEPDKLYEARIANLIHKIHAGDLLQANLSRSYTGQLPRTFTPWSMMEALQRDHPAPFGAYLRFGNCCVVSNSPERFLRLEANGQIETRPIKGTTARLKDPIRDAENTRFLLQSQKDHAENLMIVDLMRHDLSKISEVGSVKVNQLCTLETYANVHHLTSSVSAQLQSSLSAADLLIETFAPGSVTGAPKIQALKAISENEPARGPYCGSLAWFGYQGDMDSNVLIRTISFEQKPSGDWSFRYNGGSGIVADSIPENERREADAKLSLIAKIITGQHDHTQ